MKTIRVCVAAAAAALLSLPPVLAQDRIQDRDIYGSQMMSEQERNTYRERMQAAKTEEERERIRAEHHALMSSRARERGMTLPDAPPAGGMGMGGGMGGGMGRGR